MCLARTVPCEPCENAKIFKFIMENGKLLKSLSLLQVKLVMGEGSIQPPRLSYKRLYNYTYVHNSTMPQADCLMGPGQKTIAYAHYAYPGLSCQASALF